MSLVQWDIWTQLYHLHYKCLLTLFVSVSIKNLFNFKPTYSQFLLQKLADIHYAEPGKDTFKIKLLYKKVFII